MDEISNAVYHTLLAVLGLYLIFSHYDILLVISGCILFIIAILSIIALFIKS